MVEFYTKWCRFCQLLSPEYDRLVDILKETRKDVIIGRLEADINDITRTKYGINQFPILALFMPNSKRIVGVYQGNRQAVDIANWINQNCPKIEIKEDEELSIFLFFLSSFAILYILINCFISFFVFGLYI